MLLHHPLDVFDYDDRVIDNKTRATSCSKIMAWVALDRTVRDAERFKLQAPLERWRQVRDRMHMTICELGFDTSRNTLGQVEQKECSPKG